MLLNYNPLKSLFIIGTSISTNELQTWVAQEASGAVITISKDEYYNLPTDSQCIIGFQTIKYRVNFLQTVHCDTQWVTHIHPHAFVSDPTMLGNGTTIGPLACINYGVIVGNHTSIGPLVTVGHGAMLGNNCVISPGSVIGGSAVFGDNVYVGQSSSIRDKCVICSDVNFAMTSTVTKNINQPGMYVSNKKTNIEL